jgi:hypothetical protein
MKKFIKKRISAGRKNICAGCYFESPICKRLFDLIRIREGCGLSEELPSTSCVTYQKHKVRFYIFIEKK